MTASGDYEQFRDVMARFRAVGADFDHAWACATAAVVLETNDRAALLGTCHAWRAAYEGREVPGGRACAALLADLVALDERLEEAEAGSQVLG